MTPLNLHQRQALSQIIGNISAAWFSAGIISPIFIKIESLSKLLFSVITTIIMAIAFAAGSVILVKGTTK